MSGRKRPPLRLLGLHGYGQNQRSFHERTGALRKALRGRAELVSVSAPHAVPGPEPEPGNAAGRGGNRLPGWGLLGPGGPGARCSLSPQDADPRCWWLPRPREETLGAREEAASCAGLEESLEAVAGAFAAHGPFDGLLGFSQGAALAALLCARKQRGDARFPFEFAIVVAGFESRAAPPSYCQEPIAVPTLHVLGEADRVIPPALSRELAAHFVDPAILTHPGGHFVPASAPQKRAYLEFLAKFLK
ncbi:esterase OVCA2 [Dermochelys coriacea]|uniref:esterase OVCA2 n=1 Tax=Dermochelys coriacea TaxID=27794 RepID=UPI001CA7D1EE|nr:esterase OVCA2 [Dermochelys coriacea]